MLKHNAEAVTDKARRYLSGKLKIMTENNHKIVLNEVLGYKTIGINLAPHKRSTPYGGANLCKNASPLCIGGCLQESGHNIYSTADLARIARAVAFTMDPFKFVSNVRREIDSFIARTRRKGLEPTCRPNLLSDLIGLTLQLARAYPSIQFCDYTKRIGDVLALHDRGEVPSNLSWGLSLSEINWPTWRDAMSRSVFWGAVVFDVDKGADLPSTFDGLQCIDGDLHDARWLTPKGTVAALRLKGTNKAKEIARKGFAIQREDPRWNC